MVEADRASGLLLCCCHSPSSSHQKAGWQPVSSRKRAPTGRTSLVQAGEAATQAKGSVTRLLSHGGAGEGKSFLRQNAFMKTASRSAGLGHV